MKKFICLIVVIMSIFAPLSAFAGSSRLTDAEIMAAAQQGFSEILDLWRDENFELLYTRTIPSGSYDKYYFLDRMVNSIRRPACCWEKMQDVRASYVSRERVTLIARVGMEMDGAGVKFFTKNFDLIRVDGVWKIPMGEILSFAEAVGYRAFPREIIEKPLP